MKAQVELPYYSKHLLLAAFFASYNPANSDRRFFAKRCVGKMSSRAKRSAKSSKNLDKKFLGKYFYLDFSNKEMHYLLQNFLDFS